MNDKIKAALMGDPDAAAECTAAGVAIPCPFCGGEAIMAFWYATCSDKKCYCSGKLFDPGTWNRRVRMGD